MKRFIVVVCVFVILIVSLLALLLFVGEATSTFIIEEIKYSAKNGLADILGKKEVLVVNNIDGVEVSIVNKPLLDKELEVSDLWKSGKVADLTNQAKKTTTSKVIFEMSDYFDDGHFTQIDSENNEFLSIKSSVQEDGTVHIKTWLDNKYTKIPSGEDFLNWSFWFGIYLVQQHDNFNPAQSKSNEASMYAANMLKKGKIFAIKQKKLVN